MNVGLLREELCQVMGLMSQGIMGQIQPDAGSEEGMKSCSKRRQTSVCYHSFSKQTAVKVCVGNTTHLLADISIYRCPHYFKAAQVYIIFRQQVFN